MKQVLLKGLFRIKIMRRGIKLDDIIKRLNEGNYVINMVMLDRITIDDTEEAYPNTVAKVLSCGFGKEEIEVNDEEEK